jgi:valyl-tRNA synthetase
MLPLLIAGGEADWVQKHFDYESQLGRLARVMPSWMGASVGDSWYREGYHYTVEEVATSAAQNGSLQIVYDDAIYVVLLAGSIDLDAERTRITKAIEAAAKERDALAGRLSNAAFVEKAKPEAVEKARFDHAEKAAEAERLTAALARLG